MAKYLAVSNLCIVLLSTLLSYHHMSTDVFLIWVRSLDHIVVYDPVAYLKLDQGEGDLNILIYTCLKINRLSSTHRHKDMDCGFPTPYCII